MNICVYGASSKTIDKSYILHGEELGRKMAQRGHKLVFGAGASGLMGAVARGIKEENGYIIGVAPTFFHVDGVLFDDCDQLIPTNTMRERKQIMEDNADAFIMTPGGIGTYDEFFEILTLKQLNRHNKAVCVLNTNGYYDTDFELLKKTVEGNIMTESNNKLYSVFTDVDEMLDYIENYKPYDVDVAKMKDIG